MDITMFVFSPRVKGDRTTAAERYARHNAINSRGALLLF